MKINNLASRLVLTLSMLTLFFVTPQGVVFAASADSDYEELSEIESDKIMKEIPGVLGKNWEILESSGYVDSMSKTALSLLREVVRTNLCAHLLKDMPIDISYKVLKEAVITAKAITSEDVSGLLKEFEKETVKMGIKYAKEYLYGNQIKFSAGAMDIRYRNGESISNSMQYIMMYKQLSDNKAKVAIRIYSVKAIDPPASRGSVGMATGFLSELAPGEKISPFIIEISGEMETSTYSWTRVPAVTISFPDNVPDFGLKAPSWRDKYLLDPLKDAINNALGVFSFLNPKAEVTDYVLGDDSADTDKIEDEIKDMDEGKSIAVEQDTEKSEDVEEQATREESAAEAIEKVKAAEEKAEKESQEEISAGKAKEKSVEEPAVCSKYSSGAIREVAINEVAWMGSKNNASDEWIELKNTTGKDIDLKGWSLVSEDDGISISLSGTIAANNFFLLERTDDDSVPSKKADIIYKGALSNEEETLYLFNNNCKLEDYVSADPDWPAGSNKEKRTMERQDDFTWQTYSGSGYNNIFGTPKQANSQKQQAVSNKSSGGSGGGGGSSTSVVNKAEVSYCSQSGLSSPSHKEVVINEIAWMGSSNSPSDEWIELKNISELKVNLGGWQILDKDENIKASFDSVDIEPGGFYILERTNDDTVPNIVADMIYTGALSDSDESLRLFNNNCELIDEVVASPDWPAGDAKSKKTMERGSDLSWHTYSSDEADAVSGLFGTPKKENSISGEENHDDPVVEEPDLDAKHLLISEIELGGKDEQEYVEIFNQSDEDISLCGVDDCYYLSYYPSTFTEGGIPNYDWGSPIHNWKLPEKTVPAGGYYLVGISNYEGDYNIDGDGSKLNNSSGSLALFSGNPEYSPAEGELAKTDQEKADYAKSLKVDAVGWWKGKDSDAEPAVKEGSAFVISGDGKVLGRRWSNYKYVDNDNNSADFELEEESPRDHLPEPPEKIVDLSVSANPQQKNSVILSWTAPKDPDTDAEDLDYIVYYSRNSLIDESNLTDIKTYYVSGNPDANIVIGAGTDGKETVLLPDLYYDSDYHFAVEAEDTDKNISPLSAEVQYHIDAAVHQKATSYSDYRRSGKGNFEGIVGAGAAMPFIQAGDSDVFSPSLLIDENGTVYTVARINGGWGIYAFDAEGRNKWKYPYIPNGSLSLDPDGAIYFSNFSSVFALSPSGKLEWQENFDEIYSDMVVADYSRHAVYLLAKEGDNSALFSLKKENGNIVKEQLYSFSGDMARSGPLMAYPVLSMDGEGSNLYFPVNNIVIKYNISTRGTEKKEIPVKIDPKYPEFVGRNPLIGHIFIAEDGTVLFNMSSGGQNAEGRSYDIFYALDKNLSEILWTSSDYYSEPIGMNGSELYVRSMPPAMWDWYGLNLCAIDIYSGEVLWKKHWESQGSAPSFFSEISSDSQGNVYFSQAGGITGYDPAKISDDKPGGDDRIFSMEGIGRDLSSISFGRDAMYVFASNKLIKIE
jgi:hypothetical protein